MSQYEDTNSGASGQVASSNIMPFPGDFQPRGSGTPSPADKPAKKRPQNPVKAWCDCALKGKFGEFAAERLDNSTLVRRWNGSFWELMSDNDGIASATNWMNQHFSGLLSSGRTRDCWKTLTSLLHTQRPMVANDPGHVVFPLVDGYLHIKPEECRLESPDRALGLTHQIHASAGVAHGREFAPCAVPSNSLFGRYLDSSLPDLSVRSLIQEQCALSFLPNKYQQVAWWVGDGGAGKGTLSKLLLRFHSKSATVDLHKLADPHHLEPLVGATFIMVDEVEQKGRWAEKEFKSIVSGDVFTVNPKHRPSFKYHSNAYWIICSNQEPLIRDDSEGVRRRLIVVPWPGSATTRGVSTPDLDRKIFEQEGHLFLGWIVAGLMRLLKRGGPLMGSQLPGPVTTLARQIHKDNDSLETWFEACEIISSKGVEHTKTEVYEAYCKYADDAHLFVYEREAFWKRMKRRKEFRSGGAHEVRGRKGTTRTQLIRGLAITPAEIARAKRAAIYEQAEQEDRVSLHQSIGLDHIFPEGKLMDVREYQFTEAENDELMRLEELERMSA
ncbi:MAG: hypothetical protein JSR72_23750 [Proteobacteria bacterium]|nr:hypothetical protein [Pseudomonadota bacterium]